MPIDIDAVVAISTTSVLDGTGEAGTPLDVADGGISTVKLAALAVTEAKIAASAVTSAKIATSAVTSTKIAANAVTSAKIADGTIVTDDLADDAVTLAKVAQNGAADGDVISWDDTGGVWVVGPASASSGRAFVSSATFTGIVTGAAPTVTLNSPGITIDLGAGSWPHSLRIPYANGAQTDGGGELDITITLAGATREQMECLIPEARVINDQTSGNGIVDTGAVDIIQSVGAGSLVFRMTDAATLQPNPILLLQFG